RVKQRKRAVVEPIPRNVCPHVLAIEGLISIFQGLVADSETRVSRTAGLPYSLPSYPSNFFRGLCGHWTLDAISILTVAGKIRSDNGPLTRLFNKCLEEARGIARSSFFGPVVQ
ncbi:hypothetical protein C8R45DRAFT_789101, partial [Mycena sanguinolenta]